VHIYQEKKIPWYTVILLAPFIFMSHSMVRNLGPTALVLVFGMSALMQPIAKKVRVTPIKTLAFSLLSIFIMISFTNNFGRRVLAQNEKFSIDIPAGSQAGIDFIKENNIQGPMFNNFDIGSFLIWKLYPDHKVFVDGRPEAYSVEFFQEVYIPMQNNPEIWNKYSKEYDINYIIFDLHDGTPWGQTFMYRIQQDSEWKIVFKDDRTIILLKNIPANKEVISRYSLN